MSKILRFLTCLFCVVFIGDAAFAAGYECPTYREYTTCNEGYYLAYSYTGTSYNSIRYYSTPRAGNACRPCTDYDTYYNRPEGYYYCAGGTARPVLNAVTITYNLNGGSGTTPYNESCIKGQTCTLNDGATTSFYRAGYVFKGWALTSAATSGFTSYTFTAADTVYAVWEECGIGKYKPGSGTQAAAACSSCPELTPGFEYFPATTNASLTECRQGITNAEDANEYCDAPSVTTELFDIQCYATSDGTWGDCAIGNAWTAKPGSYVGIWKQTMPAEDVIENMCIPCGVGTYSEGGLINSCSSCPELTPGFEYAPLKRLTSMNNCTQVNYDISLINNNCTSLSGQESRPKINIRASAETGDWATYAVSPTEGAVYAVPGAYVNPDMMTNGEYLDIAGFDASNLCIACTVGTYSEGGNVTSCSACPDLPTGFAYDPGTGLTDITQCYALATNMAAVDADCRNVAWDMGLRVTLGASSNWDALRTDPVPTGMSALAGKYVNPDMVADTAWKSINGFNADDLCLPCPDGTYNDGQNGSGKVATECTACPGSTHPKLAELPVSTGGTGATSHRECYKYIRLAEVDSNCVSGEVRYRSMTRIMENSINYEQYPIPAQDPAPVAAPGHVVYLPNDMTTPSCIECDAGTYSAGGTVYSCSECPSGYDDNPETGLTSPDMCQISCPGGYYLAAANDATCSEVSPGYWAAEKIVNYGDTSTRTECASGLTTIGYGAGADEAADCGRVLHFGNDTLYLRSAKKTDHALHVGINGDVFYGNMGTDLSKGSLRIKLGDTTYSVYDDSM